MSGNSTQSQHTLECKFGKTYWNSLYSHFRLDGEGVNIVKKGNHLRIFYDLEMTVSDTQKCVKIHPIALTLTQLNSNSFDEVQQSSQSLG